MTLWQHYDIILGKIDVADWKSNSKYRNLTFDSELVVWWWEIVTEFADLERARLLQFATGSSRVPIAGFSALRGTFSRIFFRSSYSRFRCYK